jgi:hypothetical protein
MWVKLAYLTDNDPYVLYCIKDTYTGGGLNSQVQLA